MVGLFLIIAAASTAGLFAWDMRQAYAPISGKSALIPPERVAKIRAPTLIFHAADDTLQLFHNAEFAAARIPESRLLRFEKGGHLLLATEQDTVRESVMKHIREHGKN